MGDGSDSDATGKLSSLFLEFDAEVDRFRKAASLSCPLGCGKCCDHADTEVTPVEARLIADHVRTQAPHLASLLEERLAEPDRVECVFYDADEDFHCRIYPVRPLICRAFGYSAYSDRSGNRLFAICPFMPIAGSHGGAMQVLFEPFPPVLEHFARRIEAICEAHEAGTGKRPLGEAVARLLRPPHGSADPVAPTEPTD